MDTAKVATVLKGTYTYNGLEQLWIRTLTNMTPSGTTHFIHDIFGNVIAETNGTATGTTREYIWLPEAEIAPTYQSRAQVDRPIAVVNAVNTTPVLWYVHATGDGARLYFVRSGEGPCRSARSRRSRGS